MTYTAVRDANASGIRRIWEDQTLWRVIVESWPDRDGYRGRFIFRPDRRAAAADAREGPAALRGRTREDLLGEAYALPEARLKELFRSLG